MESTSGQMSECQVKTTGLSNGSLSVAVDTLKESRSSSFQRVSVGQRYPVCSAGVRCVIKQRDGVSQ